MSVRTDDRAPDFELPDQRGALFRLSEALRSGPVVVFFYPKDDTSGCTREACAFRDEHEDFVDAGATVVGISSDDVASHERFAGKHHLPYRLLADVGGKVRAAYGVQGHLFGLVDGRVTFVIDPSGVVRHRHQALLAAEGHVDRALATVRKLSASAA
jgi:peroxiredoxin Q/BCP